MVQIFDLTPTPSNASMIGSALGTGATKQLGLAEAERSFQNAKGNPLKLATAMARLISTSPDLARGAGPMYQAMLSQMQGENMRVNEEKTLFTEYVASTWSKPYLHGIEGEILLMGA